MTEACNCADLLREIQRNLLVPPPPPAAAAALPLPPPPPPAQSTATLPDCVRLSGLNFSKNSCFIDSVLVALLLFEIPYIRRHLLDVKTGGLVISDSVTPRKLSEFPGLLTLTEKIQQNIRDVYQQIRRPLIHLASCTLLRQHLSQYDTEYYKVLPELRPKKNFRKFNWVDKEQDTKDVFAALWKIFAMPPAVTVRRQKFYTNDLSDNKMPNPSMTVQVEEKSEVKSALYPFNVKGWAENKKGAPVEVIRLKELETSQVLVDVSAQNSRDFKSVTHLRVKYNRILEFVQIVRAEVLIVVIDRINFHLDIIDRTPVLFRFAIELAQGQKLVLVAILVHEGDTGGGHYIAYLRCRDGWYKYDDLQKKGKLTKIQGDIQRIRDIQTDSTHFIYI
jgi:hypothetical protein